MKFTFTLVALYLLFSLLCISCSETAPEPNCVRAEVIGPDCDNGWYLLRLIKNGDSNSESGSYVGQLQEGYVTTDNLPEAYKVSGNIIEVALELNSEYSPTCVAVNMMYPTVRVKKVCFASASPN